MSEGGGGGACQDLRVKKILDAVDFACYEVGNRHCRSLLQSAVRREVITDEMVN